LGAVLRPSLPGVPAILVDGNGPAVGKGKLGRAIAALVHNGVPAIVTEGHSPEELEKRITAAVLQGVPVLLLDNLQRTLESSTLESMLTEPRATIRLFGTLNQATVPCRALVIITANNASVRRDLLRRSLQLRIVVADGHPELRRFDFDPVEEVMRDRTELLSAAFTIALAWSEARDLAGNEVHRKSLGSFEGWSDLVAGAVSWLTGQNPIDLIEERQEQERGVVGDRAVFEALAAWQATLPHDEGGNLREWWRSVTAAAEPGLTDAWRGVLTFKAETPGAKMVGTWLSKHKDAVSGDLMLKGHLDRKGVSEWLLQRLPGLPGYAGSIPPAVGKTKGEVEEDSGETGGPETRQKPANPNTVHIGT
jgi:hypothetical protein